MWNNWHMPKIIYWYSIDNNKLPSFAFPWHDCFLIKPLEYVLCQIEGHRKVSKGNKPKTSFERDHDKYVTYCMIFRIDIRFHSKLSWWKWYHASLAVHGEITYHKGEFISNLFRWPSSAYLKVFKNAGLFSARCWNCFQTFSPESDVSVSVKISSTILVARWVRFSDCFCAVPSTTDSSRLDICLKWFEWSHLVRLKTLWLWNVFASIWQL